MTNANTPTDHDTTEDTREIHPAVITGALVIGLIVAFVVTASSFKLSFTTLLDLGSMAGMRDSAWVIPVVLDGPILAASIFRIALSQHTDRATVRGRRFIIAVYALAGVASMAGNAYHAVLTVTDLNAAVAAAMGALAPLMVMTMAEMMSVAISAPRRRVASASTTQAPGVPDMLRPDHDRELPAEPDVGAVTTAYLNDVVDDHGTLRDDVWETVDLYLNDPEAKGNFSAVARVLDVTTSTVTRRYDKWVELQQKVAAAKAPHRPVPGPAAEHVGAETEQDTGREDFSAQDAESKEYEAANTDLDARSYVGAAR